METTFTPDNFPNGNDLINKALTYRSVARHLPNRSLSHQRKLSNTLYKFEQQTTMNPDQLVQHAKANDNLDTDDLIRAETRKMSPNQPQQLQR